MTKISTPVGMTWYSVDKKLPDPCRHNPHHSGRVLVRLKPSTLEDHSIEVGVLWFHNDQHEMHRNHWDAKGVVTHWAYIETPFFQDPRAEKARRE